ncbi:MAG: NAD(P)H-dependent oxidoreductase subunit E [Christensenellaceae bacterium]|jgi:NADH:ubiquinone oxidoreductase subunit E|nr:NAD(P)H-dependent oxidoreductase subunit E [Christensenellaceae bacterium]
MATGTARAEGYKKLDEVILKWKGQPGGLLPVMQQAQEIIGCVDEEVTNYLAAAMEVSIAEIYGIATFYSLFTLEPKGKYAVGLCLGTACYVKGSQLVLDELQKQLDGVEVGKTTKDGLFTLDATRCIGCCGLAPAMMVNGEVFGRLAPSDIPGIIENFRKQA